VVGSRRHRLNLLVDWKGEARSRSCSRLSDLYPRGRCRERGYVTERPRARRGLPSHDHECSREDP